jgi:hypothetical protein
MVSLVSNLCLWFIYGVTHFKPRSLIMKVYVVEKHLGAGDYGTDRIFLTKKIAEKYAKGCDCGEVFEFEAEDVDFELYTTLTATISYNHRWNRKRGYEQFVYKTTHSLDTEVKECVKFKPWVVALYGIPEYDLIITKIYKHDLSEEEKQKEHTRLIEECDKVAPELKTMIDKVTIERWLNDSKNFRI